MNSLASFYAGAPRQLTTVCRCTSPVDYGSYELFGFVQFDQSFYGRRCWVHVYIFPFGVWGDECFAVIYN